MDPWFRCLFPSRLDVLGRAFESRHDLFFVMLSTDKISLVVFPQIVRYTVDERIERLGPSRGKP